MANGKETSSLGGWVLHHALAKHLVKSLSAITWKADQLHTETVNSGKLLGSVRLSVWWPLLSDPNKILWEKDVLMQELASFPAEMKGKGESSCWTECEGEWNFYHVGIFGFVFYNSCHYCN